MSTMILLLNHLVFNVAHMNKLTPKSGSPDCPFCHGAGYVEVDTFNGEHDQYKQVCDCMLSDEEDYYDGEDN